MTTTEKVPEPIEAMSLSGELLKRYHAAATADERRTLRLLLIEALRLERLEMEADIDMRTAAEAKPSKSRNSGAQAANFGGYLHRAMLSVSKI